MGQIENKLQTVSLSPTIINVNAPIKRQRLLDSIQKNQDSNTSCVKEMFLQ